MTKMMTMTEEAIKPADRHGRARARAAPFFFRDYGFRTERGILYFAARLPAFMLIVDWAMTLDDSAMAQAGVHV